MNWWEGFKGKVRLNEPLKRYTTFKIGGPARFFIRPSTIADLKLLVSGAKRYKIPILAIGAGSNILINDQGVRAAVLQLGAPCFKRISRKRNYLTIGSGVSLKQLIQASVNCGLSGAEFLAGIPGTVGGALMMNAGAWGKSIGDLVEKVRIMDYNGKIKTLQKKEIKFTYRASSLHKCIILGAHLKLAKEKKKGIKDNIKRYLGYRRNTQDTSLPNAGCIFKNPAGFSAGKLIDLCGLKGWKIGRARISERHANFILNAGNARAGDVLRLMELIKKRVKNKFNIELEPEIKIWR